MRLPPVARRIILAPVFGLALVLAVAACSSSSSSSSSSAAASSAPASSSAPVSSAPVSSAPASSTPATGNSAATAQITANWEKFFNSSTPLSQRVALLQNGSTFSSAIQ